MTVVAGAVLLYGRNNCTDLNELRCEKATLENIAAKRLPPTDDSLQLRLLIEIPGPVKYGHERCPESQKYYPKLISQTTAAPELLNNLVYSWWTWLQHYLYYQCLISHLMAGQVLSGWHFNK